MSKIEPVLIKPSEGPHRCIDLPRVHQQFDERFIQELLVEHPELLPVSTMRPDVGELLCIGREVPTRDSGSIDNLYLSTSGYIVIVETKLWRNPQGRREVVAQVLDYVKDVVTRDFNWLESVWQRFRSEQRLSSMRLFDALQEIADDDVDESEYVDRVHRVIDRGDIIALIVGDGIDTRLQQLVQHLCRDSAHLRYSLGLVSLRCYHLPDRDDLLVLPELLQEVEPVERAYVRIELDNALAGQARVISVVQDPSDPSKSGTKRITLSEDSFYESLTEAIGRRDVDRVREFVKEVRKTGVEIVFKSAAMMLKVRDPQGEGPSASLLAIERNGRLYNPSHGRRGLVLKWGWNQEAVQRTIGEYWKALHAIDDRFSLTGMVHLRTTSFLPLKDLVGKLDLIRDAIIAAVASIHRESDSE